MIGTVISYCTNDFRFIGKCIEEAKKFSNQIVIAVCDHFFDGTPENRHLLGYTYAQHPDCQFIEFAYLPDRLYRQYHPLSPDDPDWAIFWAATARYVGLQYLDPATEYLLFLDSDEIVEGDEFLKWFNSSEVLDAQRLASYLYALRPTFKAKKIVSAPLFIKKETLIPFALFNVLERLGVYLNHPGPKKEASLGVDGKPFVHHYSWVRTKEECLWKTRTWGHRNDADWPLLIEEAFSGNMKGLFKSDHEYEEIQECFFDPFKIAIPNMIQNLGIWQSQRSRFAAGEAIAEAGHVNHMVGGRGCKDGDAGAAKNQILNHVRYMPLESICFPKENVIKINEQDLFKKEIENALF